MTQFNDIPIGTSEPLNLCKGLPLFPGLNPARAGISSSGHSNPLFDWAATILFARLKSSAYYEFLFGLCGPSIAFLFENVSVTTTNTSSNQGQVKLDFTNSPQEMQAGAMMAFEFVGGVHVLEQEYLPSSWHSPWKFKWKTLLDASIRFEIDFIQLLADLIAYLLTQSGEDGLLEKDTSNELAKVANGRSSWKFLGESAGKLLPDNSLEASARFPVPVNLVDFVPALASFVQALHKIKGDLAFGPELLLEMPVAMSLSALNIEGGQGPGSSHDYVYQSSDNNSWTGVGPAFSATPTRLNTGVAWTAGFGLSLGCYFKLSACKVFCVQFDVASLDLLRLFGIRPTSAIQVGAVGTELAGTPCVLEPQVELTFDRDPAPVGLPVHGTVTLTDTVAGPSGLLVQLTVDRAMPGFPSNVTIPAGHTSVAFPYAFPGQCVPAGDPSDPLAVASPSPTTPAYTVKVTASTYISPAPACGPADVSVTVGLKVQATVIEVFLINTAGTSGPAPVWADQTVGGATLNANPSLPPSLLYGRTTMIQLLSNSPPTTAVPVKFTLLDETRQPHATSRVLVTIVGGPSAYLDPSATLMVPAPLKPYVTIEWQSGSLEHLNYSNRFILVIDAGCGFGQTEFWLDVWNWL